MRFKIFGCTTFLLLFFLGGILGQTASISGELLSQKDQSPLGEITVFLQEVNELKTSDKQGAFRFENLAPRKYTLLAYGEGYTTKVVSISLKEGESYQEKIELIPLSLDLQTIEIEAEKRAEYGLDRLNNVEGLAIYAAKKTEVIELNKMVANLATNNPREVYKSIPGLNIWESDGAGLQLSIGARGLDPNRTSNFNTRQNGYDISADALGYPESYYTPPSQALKRIEVVRGAASLQYGPQFGGLLNFVFKKGPSDKKIEFETMNTVGSFGLLSTFNSLGGTVGKMEYYGFFQRKQGDGYRDNAGFFQNNAHLGFRFKLSPKWKLGIEQTYMNYLAQQPGGLQDFQFDQDPRQSLRTRNWFQVNWNLTALTLDHRFNPNTKLNIRTFYLNAGRDALGELGPINRPDPFRERDLIQGTFENVGVEARLLHHYTVKNVMATFLVGTRYYQGFTKSTQGDANDGDTPDFEFLNPSDPEKGAYDFPSRNASLFVENLFAFGKWTITPGARFEYIKTQVDGSYTERVFAGGQVIFEQDFIVQKENVRKFPLLGLGIGRKLKEDIELYANASQNYRSINFSDLSTVNPNLIVDSLLKDENGFNIDLGIRGSFKKAIRLDASVFFLDYKDRIGLTELIYEDPILGETAVTYRTNIGDARILGLEFFAEADLLKILKRGQKDWKLTAFANMSFLEGKYLSGTNDVVGNQVELIPPFSLKTGFQLSWKELRMAYQLAYVATHFTDATNAVFVADATRGEIPAYMVHDLSVQYIWKRFTFQAGLNNLLDADYFTRRASAYPGPGIIPADGRGGYLTVGAKF